MEKNSTDGRERNKNKTRTNLNIPMSLEVKDSKAADIPQRVHVDGEFSEEIHDCRCAIRKGVPQDERGQHNRKQFLGVNHDLHRKQFTKRLMHLQFMVGKSVNVTSEVEENFRTFLACNWSFQSSGI